MPQLRANSGLRPLRSSSPSSSGQSLQQRTPAISSNPSSATIPPRINAVPAACVHCRERKVKCSATRPACLRCLKRNLKCEYTTKPGETESQARRRHHTELWGKSTVNEELFELLKHMPYQDALDALHKIRKGTEFREILDHVKAGNPAASADLVPEVRFRYDFPYRREMPAHLIKDNPYLDSLVYEAASLYSTGHQHSASLSQGGRGAASLNHDQALSLYYKPFHAAQVIDPLIYDLRPSSWTSVCDDNALMRQLLHTWFRCEYHFTAAFHKDLFLEDMGAMRNDFCSPLLVNAVLAYASVSHTGFSNRAEYWNPHTFFYRFLAEAKRLWELEAHKPLITVIQAGIILNVVYNLSGLDEIGQVYRIQAIHQAKALRLFTPTAHGEVNRLNTGFAFTAWALYNWETLSAFSFMLEPLLKSPPDWPLPNPLHNPRWYCEMWLQYPMGNSLVPSHFGQVVEARARFRIIMNDFCQTAYSGNQRATLSLDQAKQLSSRLEEWYRDLPEILSPRMIVLPQQLQLHIYYYHLILTIYEPLLGAEPSPRAYLEYMVADSRRNLETLVRLYYLRHGYEAMDLFIVIPLMLLGCECLERLQQDRPMSDTLGDTQSMLILAVKGMFLQRKNHYLAESLFYVLLGRMKRRERALLETSMSLSDKELVARQHLAQTVRSQWPVTVVKRPTDTDAHTLTNLVEAYARHHVEEVEKPDSVMED